MPKKSILLLSVSLACVLLYSFFYDNTHTLSISDTASNVNADSINPSDIKNLPNNPYSPGSLASQQVTLTQQLQNLRFSKRSKQHQNQQQTAIKSPQILHMEQQADDILRKLDQDIADIDQFLSSVVVEDAQQADRLKQQAQQILQQVETEYGITEVELDNDFQQQRQAIPQSQASKQAMQKIESIDQELDNIRQTLEKLKASN